MLRCTSRCYKCNPFVWFVDADLEISRSDFVPESDSDDDGEDVRGAEECLGKEGLVEETQAFDDDNDDFIIGALGNSTFVAEAPAEQVICHML